MEDIPNDWTGVSFEAGKDLPEVNVDCKDMAAAGLLITAGRLAELIKKAVLL